MIQVAGIETAELDNEVFLFFISNGETLQQSLLVLSNNVQYSSRSVNIYDSRLLFRILYKSFIRHYDSKLNKNKIINNSSYVRGPIQRAQI